tara:strand:+ start:1148 stop:1471 length:324 start_codon:yes stop_codon:yes gene_type:complete
MESLDASAIFRAYPNVVTVDDGEGCTDKDGNTVTIDQTLVDAARTTLDAEAAAILYQRQRTGEAGTTDTIYASIGDQLDMQYKDLINGTTTWKDHIAAVKAKYPKPS